MNKKEKAQKYGIKVSKKAQAIASGRNKGRKPCVCDACGRRLEVKKKD